MKHLILITVSFVILSFSTSALAQSPTLKFNQAWYNISQTDCMARARQALAAAQYQLTGQGDWWLGSNNQTARTAICVSCIAVNNQTQAYVIVSGYDEQYSIKWIDYLLKYIASGGTSTIPNDGNRNVVVRPAKATYQTGENITVEFSGFPGYQTDWISIARVDGATNESVQYQYTNGYQNGTMTFSALPAGSYEIRGYFNWQGTNRYDVQARSTFTVGGGNTTTTGTAVNWATTASAFQIGDVGKRAVYTCPASGSFNRIWGIDVYTNDSSICTAAVHSGLITAQYGGTVTIEILPGQSSYAASTRYGVTSLDYNTWGVSYRFIR